MFLKEELNLNLTKNKINKLLMKFVLIGVTSDHPWVVKTVGKQLSMSTTLLGFDNFPHPRDNESLRQCLCM